MDHDAVVVGAGPNGLSAAIRLAQAGWDVLLVEANDTIGGAARSAALTRPGFVHDLGSAIHPLGIGSPFFSSLPLERYGLAWIHPELPVAHPLDGGQAAVMARSLDETAEALGVDGPAYRRLMAPLVEHWEALTAEVLRPILHLPRHLLTLARFGIPALIPARVLAERGFSEEPARALLAGLAGHSLLPFDAPASSAVALVLGAAGHAVGWPMPRGGAQALSDALAAYFVALGGTIETGRRVANVDDLPSARAVLLGLTPRQVVNVAGHRLPDNYRRRLERWRYAPGVFKVDYALSEPVPWAAEACTRAGTIHVGGTLAEVAEAERVVADGGHAERPFLLAAEHTRFDPSRAPEGGHTLWAYCHVPNGSDVDMTDRIEAQLERFAPGFRDTILERHVSRPADLERMNANLVGGDVNGGASDLLQVVARPTLSPTPYRMPAQGLYLCSASTPPGGGVHGMCGYHAAEVVLADHSDQRAISRSTRPA